MMGFAAPNSSYGPLQKFCELLDGQPGLPNDRTQSAGFQVSPGMNRNSHRPRRIAGINENVMTSDRPIDDETGSRESLDNTFTVDDRQPAAAHVRRPPLRVGFRDEHRTEVPFPVLADIRGLHGWPPRHWQALPVRCRPRSRPRARPGQAR